MPKPSPHTPAMFQLRLPAILIFAVLLPIIGRADEKKEIIDIKARGNWATITATALSDDGKYLFTGEDYGLVTLWSVATGTTEYNYPGHTGHTGQVMAAAILPDGKRGVTCGEDGMVIVWDLPTGRRIHAMTTGASIPLVMSCTRDGALAATGCDDGQIMIWSIADGRRVATLRHGGPLCGILFSPDASVLAAGYSDGQVLLWNTANWSVRHTFPAADAASVGALAFTPDSRLLATGNQNGAGFIWKVADGSAFSRFAGYDTADSPPNPPVAPVFPGSRITPDDRGSIVYLCFSPDGSSLFGCVQDEGPRFWDTKTGRFLGTADWYEDSRFYIARYGFTFATAAVTPRHDYIATLIKDGDMDDYIAQVWHMSFVPVPPQQ